MQEKGYGKMKAKNAKKKTSDIATLESAACAVMAHNAKLSAHLKRGVSIFTESPPVSELLKCETNGAHKYIEDFATALKALPRGCAGVKRVMKMLRESCRELILGLKEAEVPLPDSVPEADRRAFLDNIELVASEEANFYNFVTGESGASPNCPHVAYCLRIDNSVNSIKKRFTQLNIAIQHVERDQRAKTPPKEPKDAGFLKGDRSMLRQICQTTVFGETPSAAKIAGNVRRQQVLYGAKLYKRPNKQERGCSSYRAAEEAIRAPRFQNVKGAYSLAEKNTLARAIARECKSPRDDSAT